MYDISKLKKLASMFNVEVSLYGGDQDKLQMIGTNGDINKFFEEAKRQGLLDKDPFDESYKVVDEKGNKVAQGGGFSSKKEAELFAAQYGQKGLKVVKESYDNNTKIKLFIDKWFKENIKSFDLEPFKQDYEGYHQGYEKVMTEVLDKLEPALFASGLVSEEEYWGDRIDETPMGRFIYDIIEDKLVKESFNEAYNSEEPYLKWRLIQNGTGEYDDGIKVYQSRKYGYIFNIYAEPTEDRFDVTVDNNKTELQEYDEIEFTTLEDAKEYCEKIFKELALSDEEDLEEAYDFDTLYRKIKYQEDLPIKEGLIGTLLFDTTFANELYDEFYRPLTDLIRAGDKEGALKEWQDLRDDFDQCQLDKKKWARTFVEVQEDRMAKYKAQIDALEDSKIEEPALVEGSITTATRTPKDTDYVITLKHPATGRYSFLGRNYRITSNLDIAMPYTSKFEAQDDIKYAEDAALETLESNDLFYSDRFIIVTMAEARKLQGIHETKSEYAQRIKESINENKKEYKPHTKRLLKLIGSNLLEESALVEEMSSNNRSITIEGVADREECPYLLGEDSTECEIDNRFDLDEDELWCTGWVGSVQNVTEGPFDSFDKIDIYCYDIEKGKEYTLPEIPEDMKNKFLAEVNKYIEEVGIIEEGYKPHTKRILKLIRSDKLDEAADNSLIDYKSDEISLPEATWTVELEGDLLGTGYDDADQARENFLKYCEENSIDPEDQIYYIYQDFESLDQTALAKYLAHIFEDTYKYKYQYYKRFAIDVQSFIKDNYKFPQYQYNDIEVASYNIAWEITEILEEVCGSNIDTHSKEEYDDYEESYTPISESLDDEYEVPNYKAENIEFVMTEYISDSVGIESVTKVNDTTYKVVYDGTEVEIIFDFGWDEWVYTINGKGPFAHSSYEWLVSDISNVVAEEPMRESYFEDEPSWLDDDDPVEADREHANLYGGDRTYCDICGSKLAMDEWGSYCPKCNEEEKSLNEEVDKLATNSRGDYLVRASSGHGWTVYNQSDVAIGGINTDDAEDNDEEAIRLFKINRLSEAFDTHSDIDLDIVGMRVANLLDAEALGDDQWIEFDCKESRGLIGTPDLHMSFEAIGNDKIVRGYMRAHTDGTIDVYVKNGSEGKFYSPEEIARFIAGEFGISL